MLTARLCRHDARGRWNLQWRVEMWANDSDIRRRHLGQSDEELMVSFATEVGLRTRFVFRGRRRLFPCMMVVRNKMGPKLFECIFQYFLTHYGQ